MKEQNQTPPKAEGPPPPPAKKEWWKWEGWRMVGVFALIASLLVSASIYIEGGFGRLSKAIHDSSTAQIKKSNENSKELGEKIGENAKELGVLQEKVSRVEEDIDKLEDKIDELRGFSRTSYQPEL